MAHIPKRPRPTTSQRGYGYHHRKQKKLLNALHPLCQLCQNDWSEHVHHVDRDPHNRAPSNVLNVCRACHAEIHQERD